MTQTPRPDRKFIDVRVGTRVAMRRRECGLSSADTASHLGLAEAELIDRESGKVRFAPAEIMKLATLLDILPGWFFEGLGVTVRDAPFDP